MVVDIDNKKIRILDRKKHKLRTKLKWLKYEKIRNLPNLCGQFKVLKGI